MCLLFCEKLCIMVMVVTGLPGTGKTTFAAALAAATGAVHISSDKLRKGYHFQDHYDPGSKRGVYAALCEAIAAEVQRGREVIADATFSKSVFREMLLARITPLHVPVYFFLLCADEAVVRERTSHPRPDSQADFEVYQQLREEFQPLDQAYLPLDSSRLTLDEMVRKAIAYTGKTVNT